ncbi:MAG: GntR family transcriptional regulator [Solobacterium sp.]|nr:GntR family transcriptional regulator [Solobacterium sp.]
MKGMFLISLQSKEPLRDQIRQQIIRFIDAGVLKPKDRLPSVRALAAENGINPNTVARAYADLEKEGYLVNLPKKGVYVAAASEQKTEADRIAQTIRKWKEMGVREETLRTIVAEIYEEDGHAGN